MSIQMNKDINCEYQYLNFLAKNYYLGPSAIRKIMQYFKTAKNAYEAGRAEYEKIGLSLKIIEQIEENKNKINLQKEMELLNAENIQLISINDKNYPILLKEIPNPPYLLYCKGNIELLNDRYLLAVVGSRKFTEYGRLVCERIVPKVAQSGITLVSGMALGIDSLVHRNTLNSKGKTIAVLGSGIDKKSIYPRANLNLSNEIINNNGLIISEFPMGTDPLPKNFPIRNRIISGISLAVMVIEAKSRSGSLITAFSALEQNRDVFAVPGSILSKESDGCNYLIQNGAKTVLNPQDVLKEFNIKEIKHYKELQKTFILTKEEEIIIKLLKDYNLDLDQLKFKSKFPSSLLISTVSVLEMKGLIKKDEKNNYMKI